MSRFVRVGAGTVVVVLLVVGPVALALHEQAQMRNFRVVREGVLYRSGQMTPAGLKRLFHDHGIKTVVCLRDGTTALDKAEEALCGSEEVTFVRIPPSSWGDVGGTVPVEAGVKKFKEIMNDPRNYPVLVHCFAGIHRTGAYTAIYRMEMEHWSNEDAMAEMKACGYSTLDEELDITTFLEQYRPEWKPVEKKAAPPPKEGRKQMRHSGGRPVVLRTARYGGRVGTKKNGKRASVKKAPRGHKTQSRPRRRGATTPAGAGGHRAPGAA